LGEELRGDRTVGGLHRAFGIDFEAAARWLVRHFPDKAMSPVLADSFNQAMEKLYEEVRDFIQIHYCSSNRPDPFWVAARSEIEVSDSLRQRLELWRHTFPSAIDTQGSRLFDHWNYLYVLYSKGYYRDVSLPLEGSTSESDWKDYVERLVVSKKGLIEHLPDHHELLEAVRESADEGRRPARGAAGHRGRGRGLSVHDSSAGLGPGNHAGTGGHGRRVNLAAAF
jgi:hypothetical protein